MNSPTSLQRKTRRNLRCSTYEGSCYSLMVGLGETYFAAFYIAVGISEFGLGILATVPYLIGSAFQLLTPMGVRRVKSFRIWTICTAAIQGLTLLALSLLTYFGQVNFWTLLAVASIYWASGLATGPAWSTWIEFVVPRQIRARYFSKRMRICQLCLLVAITIAGLLLRSAESHQGQLFVFVGLFSMAGLLRLVSSRALSRQNEQKHWLISHNESAKRVGDGQETAKLIRRTLPFFAAFQFAVSISGPYFAPFMLKHLEMGYLQYMVLILLGFFGRILVLPFAGRFVKKVGPVKLMLLAVIGIVPMSSLWWFHESIIALCCIQLTSGAVWGCYELSMSLTFIERIPGHQRMRIMSWFNVFNGSAMVLGSAAGGFLLFQFGATTMAFLTLFLASGCFRIIALFWFPYSMLSHSSPTTEIDTPRFQLAAPLLNGRVTGRSLSIPELGIGSEAETSHQGRGNRTDNPEVATP